MESDAKGFVAEAEIDEAVATAHDSPASSWGGQVHAGAASGGMDIDELMADDFAMREQAEIDALLEEYHGSSTPASQEPWHPGPRQRPVSEAWSDDDDYDRLFMDLIVEEAKSRGTSSEVRNGSLDVEMEL